MKLSYSASVKRMKSIWAQILQYLSVRPRLVGTFENSPIRHRGLCLLSLLICKIQAQEFVDETLLCALSIDLVVYIWPTPLEIVLLTKSRLFIWKSSRTLRKERY